MDEQWLHPIRYSHYSGIQHSWVLRVGVTRKICVRVTRMNSVRVRVTERANVRVIVNIMIYRGN